MEKSLVTVATVGEFPIAQYISSADLNRWISRPSWGTAIQMLSQAMQIFIVERYATGQFTYDIGEYWFSQDRQLGHLDVSRNISLLLSPLCPFSNYANIMFGIYDETRRVEAGKLSFIYIICPVYTYFG